MGNFPIVIKTNRDYDFYSLMGQFLSRREIVKETGFPIWDEDDKVWFISVAEDSVVGFAALRFAGETAIFCSAYVLPDYRRQGIHTTLLEVRIDYCRQNNFHHARTVASELAVPQLQKSGFVIISSTKNYAKMEVDLG